jgi:ABC-type glycerol-3-phosphate transport system permease component
MKMNKMKANVRLSIISMSFLLIALLLFLIPLYIMICGSLKTATELAANPAGIPRFPTFENYVRLVKYSGGLFFRAYFNSILISAVYTFFSVLIAAMAGYAFAKFKFKGRNVLFVVIVSTIMIPLELKMPALYIMFSKIGWLNTYQVQIVPTIANVFTMFMMRQYMVSLPDSLFEAAKIDGANQFAIFTKIVLPLSSPVIGAMSILQFLGKWNDYLWPSMMVSDPKVMPVMVLLPTLNDTMDMYHFPQELILAGCVCVTIPLFIVFLCNQKKFISSVTIGAVKG